MPYLPKTASLGERLTIAALALPLVVLGTGFLFYIVGVGHAV